MSARQIENGLPAAGIVLYLLMPSAGASPLGSWPLTPPGAAALVVAAGVAFLAAKVPTRMWSLYRVMACIVLLVAARPVLATLAADGGWLARYYVNDSWSGEPEWSSEFRRSDATRIDRTLAFEAGTLPIHFLNGASFPDGNDREISLPLTVEWAGVFASADGTPVDVEVAANGDLVVLIDGIEIASSAQPAFARATVSAGVHAAVVRYRKPPGTIPMLSVTLRDSQTGKELEVFPPGVEPRSRPAVDTLAVIADVLALLVLLAVVTMTLLAVWRSTYRVPAMVATIVMTGLGVQGYFTALPYASRFQTLTAGDDWLGFESRARDVIENGLLMTLGKPLGEGVAYFYHPFYSYVLAAVHLLAGEALFAPVFVHFLILAITALVLWSFASILFGRVAATCGLAALIAVFELDFVRYYTITLLSENLYVLTVTMCLVAFGVWARTQRTAALIQAGLWGGISAVTRPAMMMFFIPALFTAGAIALRHRRRQWALIAPAVVGASWLAVVLPFTLRNWIVARKLVLISDSLGGTFIVHNVPSGTDPQTYLTGYAGGIFGSIAVLLRIAIEQPAAFVALQVQKLGFTLGMVHWFGDYRPHPELVAITLLYFVMLVLSGRLRSPELWPVHVFVAAHWASMALTSPWNYGYRLILPPYVFTSLLAVAAAAAYAAQRLRPSHQ